MENPKCPYCGGDMRYYWDNNPMKPEGWFYCPKCHSQAPTAKTDEAAKAAATKRHRAKGEWIEDQDYLFESVYTCSACGSEFVLESGTPKDNEYNFCPNCGADMKGEGDES